MRLRQKLAESFGKTPDLEYFHGDMDSIRAYADYRRSLEPDRFMIDDVTWNDLDMDDLFKRVNLGLTASGEQYLYYWLRAPALDREEFERRKALIDEMRQNAELRLDIQVILSKLGCSRRASFDRVFRPVRRGPGAMLLYVGMTLLLVLGLVLTLLKIRAGAILFLAMLFINPFSHELIVRKIRGEFDAVNYTVGMLAALHRIRKLKKPLLDRELAPAYAALDRLSSVRRTGGVSAVSGSMDFADILMSVLMLDLVSFEFVKRRLGQRGREVFLVHAALGRVDSAIAAASYRAGLAECAVPDIDFDAPAPFIDARAVRHPLLENAVPNDLLLSRSLLVTGSNASGKSTYLKTAALCALTAQSIAVCPALSCRMSAFRLYSSMALRDSLQGGESYYIVETKSLKRIMDAVKDGGLPVLCVIDEVLRGTNTVERIAASSVLLEKLGQSRALCLAASHDIELCDLLKSSFDLGHFEETLGENEMLFDYRLRPGRAVSRNAIDLLRLIGFDGALVAQARERAERWLETKLWQ